MEEMDIVAKRSRLLFCSPFFPLVTLVVGQPIMAVRPYFREIIPFLPPFLPSPSCLDNFTVCVFASSTPGGQPGGGGVPNNWLVPESKFVLRVEWIQQLVRIHFKWCCGHICILHRISS